MSIFFFFFFFVVWNSRFFRSWKKSLSHSVLKKWMSARLIHFFWGGAFYFCWWIRVSPGESVSVLQWKLWKRERAFENDVFIENTCLGIGSKKKKKKNAGWNLNADVVLPRSRCSPGQWFPAIFVVGTSGIPPKLNYWSVKSYTGITQ